MIHKYKNYVNKQSTKRAVETFLVAKGVSGTALYNTGNVGNNITNLAGANKGKTRLVLFPVLLDITSAIGSGKLILILFMPHSVLVWHIRLGLLLS